MGIVSESSGTVSTCAFVCDGQLKRNAFITVTISNGTAQCESLFYNSVLIQHSFVQTTLTSAYNPLSKICL